MKKEKGRAVRDLLLIALLVLLTLLAFLAVNGRKEAGGYAVVRVKGEEKGRYPLLVPATVSLNGGTNILNISEGRAWLTEADCPDKLCVKQGKIQYTGQCITCLPNKLTVTIVGGDDSVDIVL